MSARLEAPYLRDILKDVSANGVFMTRKKFDILKGKTKPLFFRYSIPNILSIIALSSAQLVDAFFIGNYAGSTALAAVNIVLPVFSLVFSLGIMLCTGGSVICAKALGERKFRAASNIFSKIVFAVLGFSLFSTFCGVFFPKQVVSVLGANDILVGDASLYLYYISFFYVFFLGTYCLAVFARVEEHPLLAFTAMMTGAVINILFDWLFIYILGWGVRGAAIATGISQISSFILILRYFLGPDCRLHLRFHNIGAWKDIARAAYNGLSELANELSIGVTTFIFNWIMITKIGVVGVAAYTVINYALFIGTMLSYGIGDTIVPLISTNYGAGKVKRIRSFLRTSLVSGFSLGFFIFLVLLLFPEKIADIFLSSDEHETKKLAVEFINLMKWAFLFSSVSIILSSYFTAMQKPLASAIVAISRSLIFPTVFILTLPEFLSSEGIFISIPLAELVTIIISLILWNKNRPEKLVEE